MSTAIAADTMTESAPDTLQGGQLSVPDTLPKAKPKPLPLGPLKTIHVFWMAGMSCDGCTIAVAGATNPGI